jgi:hypothetical protein
LYTRTVGRASSLAENMPETEVDSRTKKAASHSGRLLVRMPGELHGELARAAGAEGVSLNQFITGVLSRAVDWRSGDVGDERSRLWHRRASDRATWLVLGLNLVVVLVAAAAAITLLVVALQQT